jgi:sugar O-acyltransferase (sialic acid O-acetyltransferase NeuD family)
MAVNPFELKYAGLESNAGFPWASFDRFALGIGDNILRAKVAQRVQKENKQLITLKHPQALISKKVQIGDGTFIARGVCINPLAKIGKGVIVNTSAVVEHECTIDDYAHVAPCATLAGNVTIQTGAFIGANAIVKQGVTVGANAVIGAGSVVLHDIPQNTIMAGVPARPIKINK